MRILYLHPRAWSGEYPLLKTLHRRGHHVHVLEEWRGEPRSARFETDYFLESDDGIPTLWYDPHKGLEKVLTWPVDRLLKRAFSGRNFAHRMWLIHVAVARFRPDVVICSDGFTYALPAAWLRRFGWLNARLVSSFIGGDILDCPEAEYGRRRTPLVNALIRGALGSIDVLRPVSPMLADVLIKDGAMASRIHVVPSHLTQPLDGLLEIREYRADIAAQIRRRYGIADDRRLLVTLSYNFKGKGLHLLASQWKQIREVVPEAHWLLCGPENPWLRDAVQPVLEASGESASVTFTGALRGQEVYEHLAAGELHISPTLCEGLNMVTVEAAAVGTPTISGDGAGIADWITRYRCGTVVPSGDAEALGGAVIDALHVGSSEIWRQPCHDMADEFAVERVAAQLESLCLTTTGNAGVSQ